MSYKKLYTLPLLLSLLSTLSFAEGEATNLKAWNIKESSVKIAFKDNNDDDLGFSVEVYEKFENNDYKGWKNGYVDASPGTGKYLMGKVSGLKPGTEYTAIVVTFGSLLDGLANQEIFSKTIKFKTKGETTTTNYGKPASSLKAWRVKETSVKISFKDNTYWEESFKIIIRDKEGTEVATQEVKASPSTGKTLIGKVNGLKAGTDYTAVVSSYVDTDEDLIGNKMDTSKPLAFKTKGTSSQPTDKVIATNLKTWSIRDTSAMISFIDSSYPVGETYFINADTEERMTLNSKGIIPIPNNKGYSIGKMIDLIPDTTYRVKIIFEAVHNTQRLAPSKVITFKTKE